MTTRTAIVTGAASGIGRATTELLLADGWNVCAFDRDPVTVPKGMNARFLARIGYVSSTDDCEGTVAETIIRFDRVDALLHFAALHDTNTWDTLDDDTFNRVLGVNVTGAFLMAKACANWMKDHGGGAVVLTGSGSINV